MVLVLSRVVRRRRTLRDRPDLEDHPGDVAADDDPGAADPDDLSGVEIDLVDGVVVAGHQVAGGLLQCPDVRQVAVVGVPHPDWGEAVVAYVVGENGPVDKLTLRTAWQGGVPATLSPQGIGR